MSVLYIVHAESGALTSNTVQLQTSSFQSDPPTFTLSGATRGGPPTSYTWTRDGEVLSNSETYSISIAVTSGDILSNRLNTAYGSTLVVTGNLSGVYEYTVSNRATTSPLSDTFLIQGKL